MRFGMRQQDLAVASGYWPLIRYSPAIRAAGRNPFRLDAPRPTIAFRDYARNEIRYSALARSDPKVAEALMERAQDWVAEKYRQYEALAAESRDSTERRA
jgi:pyruvate-ferredoxin/flavodoxin oxidoreductase